MNGELYVKKAVLQASKGDFDSAVQSMNQAILAGDDEVAIAQAHCFLGEYYFVKQDYAKSGEHLEWLSERAEDLEQKYDDLLNDELVEADVLLDIMARFLLYVRSL